MLGLPSGLLKAPSVSFNKAHLVVEQVVLFANLWNPEEGLWYRDRSKKDWSHIRRLPSACRSKCPLSTTPENREGGANATKTTCSHWSTCAAVPRGQGAVLVVSGRCILVPGLSMFPNWFFSRRDVPFLTRGSAPLVWTNPGSFSMSQPPRMETERILASESYWWDGRETKGTV